jgi:hypothetical protein
MVKARVNTDLLPTLSQEPLGDTHRGPGSIKTGVVFQVRGWIRG